MNIMVVGRCLPSKGSSAGKFEYEQASALARRGHTVTYCYSDNRSVRANKSFCGLKVECPENGLCTVGSIIPVGGLPYRVLAPLKSSAYKRCLEHLSKHKSLPEVAYIHFPALSGTYDLIKYLKKYNIPIVCMEHWSAVQTKRIKGERRRLLTAFAKDSSELCCVSDDLADSFAEIAGVDREKILVVPNAVSSGDFYYSGSVKGISKGSTRFIWTGRIERVKGLDVLLAAFASLASNTELLIVGDGSATRETKALCKQLNISNRVRFLGWKSSEELGAIYRSCDCFVSASAVETFCVPFAEAWMCGLPVIGVSTNPLRHYFSDSNGLMFSPGDVGSLAEAMNALCEKKDGYNRQAIAEEATMRFSEDAVLSQVEEILRRCVGGRS